MDLALNNLQRLICHKTKQTNQTFTPKDDTDRHMQTLTTINISYALKRFDFIEKRKKKKTVLQEPYGQQNTRVEARIKITREEIQDDQTGGKSAQLQNSVTLYERSK